MLTKQDIKWAKQQDWFRKDLRTGAIVAEEFMYCPKTKQSCLQTFVISSKKELNDFAGY